LRHYAVIFLSGVCDMEETNGRGCSDVSARIAGAAGSPAISPNLN
jgi:hypothetical protein